MPLVRLKRILRGAKGVQNDFREVAMKKGVAGVLVILWLVSPLVAHSSVPLDMLKVHIDKILEVLRDPALKGDSGRKVKKKRIQAISEEMFDFTELSKRSLAQNWNKFNPDQQKEFIRLYKSLLEETYSDKVSSYTDEKIVIKRDVNLSEKTVEVQTTVITKTSEVPIDYRLIEKNGDWKVYDVVIEGVSLVSNYRTQFREILASRTPEALLEILRNKVGKGQAS
jgi:phospholipid transport system substrate-binding protein